jgi:hypothetical protein
MQSSAEVGEEIRNNHLKATTIKQYTAKFKVFYKWLENKPDYSHLITNRARKELDLANVNGQVYTDFFGYICRKRDRKGNTLEPVVYESYENVSGYRSVFAYFYKKGEFHGTQQDTRLSVSF